MRQTAVEAGPRYRSETVITALGNYPSYGKHVPELVASYLLAVAPTGVAPWSSVLTGLENAGVTTDDILSIQKLMSTFPVVDGFVVAPETPTPWPTPSYSPTPMYEPPVAGVKDGTLVDVSLEEVEKSCVKSVKMIHSVPPGYLRFVSVLAKNMKDLDAMPMDYLINSMDKASMLDGEVLEFGVYQGGSVTRLANHFAPDIVHGFDSFEGPPEDWIREDGVFNVRQ